MFLYDETIDALVVEIGLWLIAKGGWLATPTRLALRLRLDPKLYKLFRIGGSAERRRCAHPRARPTAAV
jgi:hypothetical protein